MLAISASSELKMLTIRLLVYSGITKRGHTPPLAKSLTALTYTEGGAHPLANEAFDSIDVSRGGGSTSSC